MGGLGQQIAIVALIQGAADTQLVEVGKALGGVGPPASTSQCRQ